MQIGATSSDNDDLEGSSLLSSNYGHSAAVAAEEPSVRRSKKALCAAIIFVVMFLVSFGTNAGGHTGQACPVCSPALVPTAIEATEAPTPTATEAPITTNSPTAKAQQ